MHYSKSRAYISHFLIQLGICDKQQQLIASMTPVYILDVEMIQNLTSSAVQLRIKFNSVLEQLRTMWESDQEGRSRYISSHEAPLTSGSQGRPQYQHESQRALLSSTQLQSSTNDIGHPGPNEGSSQSNHVQEPIQLTAQALENALEVIEQLKRELSNGQSIFTLNPDVNAPR